MNDFEEQIRLRLTSNANDFDAIVVDMLMEIERQQAEIDRLKKAICIYAREEMGNFPFENDNDVIEYFNAFVIADEALKRDQ